MGWLVVVGIVSNCLLFALCLPAVFFVVSNIGRAMFGKQLMSWSDFVGRRW